MEHFSIETRDKGKALFIQVLIRKFDAACAKEFREAVAAKWSEGIQRVEMDLSNVDFIDSSGVGALLSVQKRLGTDSDPMVLLNPRANVVSVIELLRLHRVFTMRQTDTDQPE